MREFEQFECINPMTNFLFEPMNQFHQIVIGNIRIWIKTWNIFYFR